MIKAITEKLTECPSYLKKGDFWLADYFKCSPLTIKRIKASLREVKRDYVDNLNYVNFN